jgi:hypothetical protein
MMKIDEKRGKNGKNGVTFPSVFPMGAKFRGMRPGIVIPDC